MRNAVRKSVYVLYVSLIFGAFQNCAPMHGQFSELGSNSSSAYSAEVIAEKFATTLQPVLRANCSGCHGASQVPRFAVADPLEAVNTIMQHQLVDLDNPANSYFVAKIMSGHQGFTPVLAAEVQAAIQALAASLSGNSAPADTTNPSVLLTSPAAGASFTGNVSATAMASDNVSVAGVQFYVDGSPVNAEDLAAPYETVLTSLSAGAHTISARARDAAGNMANSAGIAINVTVPVSDNIAPVVSITAPAAAATVSGTVNVTATATDNISVAGVQLYVDNLAYGNEDVAAPYSIALITTSLTNGNHTLTVRARDAAGNMTTSAARTVNVSNVAPDLTAPTVAITAPVAGAVTGTVNIAANASDNVGVAGVTFLINGMATGVEDTTAPYSVAWNTSNLAAGTYVLVARARDAAGNMTNSASVTVTKAAAGNPNATYTWISQNILVPQCVGCHGGAAGLSYNTYTATLKSVSAGNPGGSKLYTSTNSGNMPIGGGAKLSAVQLQAIYDWILAGALNN